jgi:hypothetical protein
MIQKISLTQGDWKLSPQILQNRIATSQNITGLAASVQPMKVHTFLINFKII